MELLDLFLSFYKMKQQTFFYGFVYFYSNVSIVVAIIINEIIKSYINDIISKVKTFFFISK